MSIRGLYAIVDPRYLPVAHSCTAAQNDPALAYVQALLDGGCQIVQLRVKDIEDADAIRYRLAKAIMQLKTRYDFCFIVNDDITCAKELGADGVHIGCDDGTIAEVRSVVGPGVLIGFSSHSLEEAQAAEGDGADYVAFGAIFSSATKGPGYPVQGLQKLSQVVQALSVPVVAIGGIHRNNIQLVSEAGVAAVAMITGLSHADNPCEETAWYVRAVAQLPHSMAV